MIESSLRSFSLVPLASLFFQKTYWLHSWHFYHKHAIKKLSRDRCARLKKTNLKQDTNLTKEGSFSTTHCSNNCKHISSNFTCQTHKRNAIEVTKIWQVFNIDSNVLCAECEMVYIFRDNSHVWEIYEMMMKLHICYVLFSHSFVFPLLLINTCIHNYTECANLYPCSYWVNLILLLHGITSE